MPGTPPRFFALVVRVCCCALVSFFACGAVSFGATGSPGADHVIRVWTTDDGLPHNSAGRILQDRTGFLWFATVGGLARFDGREFREIKVPAEHRPRGFNIRAIAEEKSGALVVLPTSGTVLRLVDGKWSEHPVTTALNGRTEWLAELHVDSVGVLWIATGEGSFARWSEKDGARLFDTKLPGIPRPRRITFARDESGRTWIGSESFLATEQDGQLRPHPQTPPEPLLIATSRNGIWVCTEHSLQRLERGRLVLASTEVPWDGEFAGVRHMFEDSRGVLWIASSRRGLLRYTDGKFVAVPTPYPSVAFVMEDREGNLWLGTDGRGVVQLREKPYHLYNLAAGLSHEVVSSLHEDANGSMWLANRTGGLARVDPDGTLHANLASGLHRYANVVAVDSSNRLWFGGGQSGLFRWDRKEDSEAERLPLPKTNPHILFAAKNGDLWFADESAVAGFYHDNEPHALTEKDGFTPRGVSCIAQDPAGKIWLVDAQADLQRWDGQQFSHVEIPRDALPRPVHTMYADQRGRLWFGTAGGLVVKEGDQFHLIMQAQGLADDIILQIVEDDAERLWFAARRGLFYAEKSELLAVAAGRVERVTSHMFGRNQGLSGLSPTANYHPAAAKSRDGKLWFATTQGALAIDPTRLSTDQPPPPVLVDETLVDEHSVATNPLRIPSGRHRVVFRFAALSFTAPEDVVLRHQLEGADRQWIDTGSDRTASYTNLPPGNYRLRVIARNSAGRWNTDGATLAFTVVPAWWETWIFRAAIAILAATLIAWLARAIVQRRLRERLRRVEQEHALEKERVRIARDLHDDLGASLTEVGLLADRLAATPTDELRTQLGKLAWSTRRISTDLAGIVWSMSPRNSTLDRLAEFIRQYAQKLFRGLSIACSVKGVDVLPPLPLAPELQHQLIAATKEALNNVLKHSQATEVAIELRLAEDKLILVVRDNGVGFPMTAMTSADGNGLRNIRARIDEIGGESRIESAADRGTRVTLRIPLHVVAPALNPSKPS